MLLLDLPYSAASSADLPSCVTDAMIVFDASGSMAGMGFGESSVTRIEQVRRALAEALPEIAPVRNLGLITFGPGLRRQCDNIELKLPPLPNSADRILAEINTLQPYGQTPITRAVRQAAEVLRFRNRPAVIVLLTDGEETCGGDTCGLAQKLHAEGVSVTVHVIGYMLSATNLPTGGQYVRCLSERTGGMFISTQTTDELVGALRKTLGCPAISAACTLYPARLYSSHYRSRNCTMAEGCTLCPPR